MKDCVSCVHEYLSPMSDTCRECGIAMLNYEEAKPKRITNADRLRTAATIETMAMILSNSECYDSVEDWLDWLRQEVVSDG